VSTTMIYTHVLNRGGARRIEPSGSALIDFDIPAG
jgi:hypothetical protein